MWTQIATRADLSAALNTAIKIILDQHAEMITSIQWWNVSLTIGLLYLAYKVGTLSKKE
jgi:hypothetical protein